MHPFRAGSLLLGPLGGRWDSGAKVGALDPSPPKGVSASLSPCREVGGEGAGEEGALHPRRTGSALPPPREVGRDAEVRRELLPSPTEGGAQLLCPLAGRWNGGGAQSGPSPAASLQLHWHSWLSTFLFDYPPAWILPREAALSNSDLIQHAKLN